MDREMFVAQSGGKLLPELVLFLETKEHPRFRRLLFGKEAVKTFFYKCSNSGKMNPLHRHWWEQSCTGSNAAPEIPLQKNLSRKIARFLVSKISPATGVNLFTWKWMKLTMEISSIENSNVHIQIKNLNICTTHRKTCCELGVRVEFLLKTESGYLRDAEVTWFTLANP